MPERSGRGDGSMPAPAASGSEAPLSPLELALGQGTAAEQASLRERMARDPLVALQYAEERQFLEQLREQRIPAGPRFRGLMAEVTVRAERRLELRARPPRLLARRSVEHAALSAAAALLLFAVLAVLDPLRLRVGPADEAGSPIGLQTVRQGTEGLAPVAPATGPWTLAEAAEPSWVPILGLEPGSRLRLAFDRYAALDSLGSAIDGWLSSQNALALRQMDFEQRGSAALRRQALRLRGNLPDVDDRIQHLVQGLRGDFAAAALDEIDAMSLAYGLRALLAGGSVRSDDLVLRAMASELTARLPELGGGILASALAALAEMAAVCGDCNAAVAAHGQRLVAEVLHVGEPLPRRRPPLLSHATPAAQVADAGRFLVLGAAFGLDPRDALVVRMLLAAHLQERREHRSETPDVLAALCYGFGDLLPADERLEAESRLRSWRPVHLAPDFIALQQLAWSRSPEVPGFARFQLELRRAAALPTPDTLLGRAALVLCLAVDFARPGALGGDLCRG